MDPTTGKPTQVSHRIAAIVVTIGLSLHWIPAYWWDCVKGVFVALPDPWAWRLSYLLLAILLTVWSPRSFGLQWGRTGEDWRFSAIVGGGLCLLTILSAVPFPLPARFQRMGPSAYLCGPIIEELIFRGFLYTVLNDAFPRIWKVGKMQMSWATWMTAAMFGLWHLGGLRWPRDHYTLFQVGATAFVGVLLGMMRDRTGSIAAPWIVHTALILLALGLSPWANSR